MKKSIGSMFLLFVLLTVLVVSGCAPAPTPEPTSTPAPTAVMKTSAGDVVITKVEIVSEGKAAPGYQILSVWFEGANGSKVDGRTFFDASKGAYVMGDDGSKTTADTGRLLSGKLMVGFTPPTSANKFTLFWPGNDPIELSLSR